MTSQKAAQRPVWQFEREKRNKKKSEAEYSWEGTLGSRVLASAPFNGPYKNNWGEKKKLYYSRQCQLVWHAAVSPSLLPIHKKNIFSSHGVSMNNITSQTTRPPACPVTYGTRARRDTEEPGDSRITTTISLRCRKPAGGAKKRLSTFSVHQHAP